MPVVGVPNIRVLKPIHVHIQPVRIHVHVGNEEMCDKLSIPPPLEYSRG